jgi:hypothetical protein
VKKSKTALLYVVALVIGLIPAIVALVQQANTYTLAKYYLYTVIIVVVLWILVKRFTRKKDAI